MSALAPIVCAAVILCLFSWPGVGAPMVGQAAPADRPRASRVPAPRFEEFQVAAGTTLAVDLRTTLSSASSRRAELVEGRLRHALSAGDVELVPAGAVIMGTVSDVEPAGRNTPGRLTFAFHVIEHPLTGSRATIHAAPRTFESVKPRKGKVYADVSLERGIDASVLLTGPLLVRLPVRR